MTKSSWFAFSWTFWNNLWRLYPTWRSRLDEWKRTWFVKREFVNWFSLLKFDGLIRNFVKKEKMTKCHPDFHKGISRFREGKKRTFAIPRLLDWFLWIHFYFILFIWCSLEKIKKNQDCVTTDIKLRSER